MIANTDSGLKDPALHASIKLDNHIQMQYEIIAKQLTLLRDEVGPQERLVFLELPTSLYAVPGAAKHRLARVSWKVNKVCGLPRFRFDQQEKMEQQLMGFHNYLREGGQASGAVSQPDSSNNDATDSEDGPTPSDDDSTTSSDGPSPEDSPARDNDRTSNESPTLFDNLTPWAPEEVLEVCEVNTKAEKARIKAASKSSSAAVQPESLYERYLSRSKRESGNQQDSKATDSGHREENKPDGLADDVLQKLMWRDAVYHMWSEKLGSREVRTVDIIPRTSALNVVNIFDRQRGFSFGGKLVWLLGFGLAPNYQRDRRVFEQFVHQESFASGYGRGSNEFGWTFGPVPGQRWIKAGARTTYAVLVIPKDAVYIRLQAETCHYPRRNTPPKPFSSDYTAQVSWKRNAVCEAGEIFDIPVPIQEQAAGFYLKEVRYTQVESGKRITVHFLGQNFSPQIGILVNGKPLTPIVKLANPAFTSGRLSGALANGEGVVTGHFELVNSETIVASFKMADSYEGTPLITFVTPQKSRPINYWNILVNKDKTSLKQTSKHEPMFRKSLTLSALDILRHDKKSNRLEGTLKGTGFRRGADISVNGEPVVCKTLKSTSRYEICLDVKWQNHVGEWKVEFSQDAHERTETLSAALSNSTTPKITDYDVIRWTENATTKSGELDINLKGKNFVPNMIVSGVGVTTGPSYKFSFISSSEVELFDLRVATKKRDRVRLQLEHPTLKASGVISVPFPREPSITEIKNPNENDKNTGPAEGGYQVTIGGKNLKNVTKVFFGKKPVSPVSRAQDGLTAEVPAGEGGETVIVRLLTAIKVNGVPLDNGADASKKAARFIYKKKPAAASSESD